MAHMTDQDIQEGLRIHKSLNTQIAELQSLNSQLLRRLKAAKRSRGQTLSLKEPHHERIIMNTQQNAPHDR